MNEPKLYGKNDSSSQVYRFLWLRTFHNPYVFRLVIDGNNNGTLFIKHTNGAGGYGVGDSIYIDTVHLSDSNLNAFKKLVDGNKFWKLKTDKIDYGCDGSQWVIEAIHNSKYHLVHRWTPEKGIVHSIGKTLIDMNPVKINSIY
jgi:hypothetical protein